MISIVTGTLNRVNLIDDLIKNTVGNNDNLELILVDGGSSDGTIEKIKSINHPNVKLIEVGHRSGYSHFMNLGITNSKYEWVCQWNDDVLLVNDWNDIISALDEENDFYLFNWKYGTKNDITNESWLDGLIHTHGWCLLDDTDKNGEIVMNYGIYNKKIFRKIGMYNNAYSYYYADGDMAYRAHKFGFKHKSLRDIKICSLYTPKQASHASNESIVYEQHLEMYNNGILPENLNYL